MLNQTDSFLSDFECNSLPCWNVRRWIAMTGNRELLCWLIICGVIVTMRRSRRFVDVSLTLDSNRLFTSISKVKVIFRHDSTWSCRLYLYTLYRW